MENYTKTELNALRRIYASIEQDSTFYAWEAFIDWAWATEWRTRMELYKRDMKQPHGPDNSYWYHSRMDRPDVISPFCEGCTITCPGNRTGCLKWREYYVKNWNQNICRKPKPKIAKREVFQYEHPDLVREWIVFG